MATTTTATRGASNGTIPMHDDVNASAWREATITKITVETPTVKTFTFSFGTPIVHVPGQHYEIRLTSEDGYQAARLYSAASAGTGENTLELTIALLPGGEVSPYMDDIAQIGDKVEIRGPLGKFFVWQPGSQDPVLLIGGGSGVVPLRCILHAHGTASLPMQLIYSARTYDEIIYKPELLHDEHTLITLTGDAPVGWQGGKGRINAALLGPVLKSFPAQPVCYVCGSTAFVEAIADMLVSLGVPPAQIKAERFGATATSR